jgi:hypothetical protein
VSDTIWKFPLRNGVTVDIDMPDGAEIVHVDVRHNVPCLWAVVNPDAPVTTRRFQIAGTGHPIKKGPRRHVGTFLTRGGDFVWHLFEMEDVG